MGSIYVPPAIERSTVRMVLDELDLSEVAQESNTDRLKFIIAGLFWTWYDANKDDKLVTIRKWFISKTIYLRDLEGVFVLLFGHR